MSRSNDEFCKRESQDKSVLKARYGDTDVHKSLLLTLTKWHLINTVLNFILLAVIIVTFLGVLSELFLSKIRNENKANYYRK